MKKLKSETVKINTQLKKQVKQYIKDGRNKLKYPHLQTFIDIAVYEKLNKCKKGVLRFEKCW